MPTPLFDVLLVLHAFSAIVGFGSIAIGSLMAWRGRVSKDVVADEGLVRYFGASGGDWPGRLVFLVPVLGICLVLGPHGGPVYAGRTWPWLGFGLWFVACGVVSVRMWPAEQEAQVALAALTGAQIGHDFPDGEPDSQVQPDSQVRLDALVRFRDACARMERAGAVVSLCAVVALVLMVWQPG